MTEQQQSGCVSLILLNTICDSSRNARIAFQDPFLYNRLIDLISSCCNFTDDGITVIYKKIKEEYAIPDNIMKNTCDSIFRIRKECDESLERSNEDAKSKALKNSHKIGQPESRSHRRRQNCAVSSEDPGSLNLSQNGSVNASLRPSVPKLNINQIGVNTKEKCGRKMETAKSASTRSTPYSQIFSTSFDCAQNRSRIFILHYYSC